MPSNRRQALKEKVNQVILKVEKSRDELIGLALIYKEHHPEYYNVFMQLSDHLDRAVKPLNETRDII